MGKRTAAKEVGAERFVMVFVEQVGNVGPGCDMLGKLIAAVEIDNAVARNRADIYSRQPRKRIDPPVPQRAVTSASRVGRSGAELMIGGIG